MLSSKNKDGSGISKEGYHFILHLQGWTFLMKYFVNNVSCEGNSSGLVLGKRKQVLIFFTHSNRVRIVFYKGSWNIIVPSPCPVDGSVWAARFRWDLFLQLSKSKYRCVLPNDNLRSIFSWYSLLLVFILFNSCFSGWLWFDALNCVS